MLIDKSKSFARTQALWAHTSRVWTAIFSSGTTNTWLGKATILLIVITSIVLSLTPIAALYILLRIYHLVRESIYAASEPDYQRTYFSNDETLAAILFLPFVIILAVLLSPVFIFNIAITFILSVAMTPFMLASDIFDFISMTFFYQQAAAQEIVKAVPFRTCSIMKAAPEVPLFVYHYPSDRDHTSVCERVYESSALKQWLEGSIAIKQAVKKEDASWPLGGYFRFFTSERQYIGMLDPTSRQAIIETSTVSLETFNSLPINCF